MTMSQAVEADFELECPLCGAGVGVLCDCIGFGEEDTKEIEIPTRQCECGAEAVKSNIHSNWCPKNGER